MAESAGIPARICLTKVDLVTEAELEDVLALYCGLELSVILTSTVDGRGLTALRDQLQGRLSVFVGKSGVGKTSLLNAIEPGLGLRVNAVGTGKIGKGDIRRHTSS